MNNNLEEEEMRDEVMARRFNQAPSTDAIARAAQRMLRFKREGMGEATRDCKLCFSLFPL